MHGAKTHRGADERRNMLAARPTVLCENSMVTSKHPICVEKMGEKLEGPVKPVLDLMPAYAVYGIF